ncbi:hypothetical protein X975_03695, partial [Stegodyphus mimosarum]
MLLLAQKMNKFNILWHRLEERSEIKTVSLLLPMLKQILAPNIQVQLIQLKA